MNKAKNGHNVKVHYKGTLDDGTVFGDSHEHDQTLEFKLGSGHWLPAFEEAIVGMSAGETKTLKIASADAYGERDPEAVVKVPKSAFPEGYDFAVGNFVQGQNQLGQPVRATISSVAGGEVSLDHNHPLAGKDLNFEVELLEVNE